MAIRTLSAFSLITALVAASPDRAATAAAYEQLYAFPTTTGQGPHAPLIADAAGALYGTVAGGNGNYGEVFKLAPPPAGRDGWTATVLHVFRGGVDGAYPTGRLVFNQAGALYGTTCGGGTVDHGTVFKLTPPTPTHAAWTKTELYRFQGGTKGGCPSAGLVFDDAGALYGTNYVDDRTGPGAVFRLNPPAPGHSGWTRTVLHHFKGGFDGSNPASDLVWGADRSLYGTAASVAFKMTPPTGGSGAWKNNVIYRFNSSPENLVPDGTGSFYGTTYGDNGTVFKLTAPTTGHAAWRFQTLYRFRGIAFRNGRYVYDASGPQGMVLTPAGEIFGVTSTGGGPADAGTVFELSPPTAGHAAWSEKILYAATAKDYLTGGLLLDQTRAVLYGTTLSGGKGSGSVFRITP